MYVTIYTVDQRKWTVDERKVNYFSPGFNMRMNAYLSVRRKDAPPVEEGYLTVNMDNVILIRAATKEEIEHAQIHGW